MQEKIGIGRRKTAVSAVRLRPGTGKIDINGKELGMYFPSVLHREIILSPFKTCHLASDKYDLVIRVKGGGIDGQVVATRLGISRALVGEDDTRKADLKDKGYLTRDSRKRERKKYGRAGARKRYQFSKR
jgi:small subunit ribosomal protein S9